MVVSLSKLLKSAVKVFNSSFFPPHFSSIASPTFASAHKFCVQRPVRSTISPVRHQSQSAAKSSAFFASAVAELILITALNPRERGQPRQDLRVATEIYLQGLRSHPLGGAVTRSG